MRSLVLAAIASTLAIPALAIPARSSDVIGQTLYRSATVDVSHVEILSGVTR